MSTVEVLSEMWETGRTPSPRGPAVRRACYWRPGWYDDASGSNAADKPALSIEVFRTHHWQSWLPTFRSSNCSICWARVAWEQSTRQNRRGSTAWSRLKILPKFEGQGAEFANRFAREAQTLAKLNHPNIVSIHDYGETGGWYFFIMEYVDGVNLRQAIQAKSVEPKEALVMVGQVCDALQFAHDEGVVHRDIKPENILLDKRGRVKIADFGLAKLLGHSREDRADRTRIR